MRDDFKKLDAKRTKDEQKLIIKMLPHLKDYADDELLSILSKTVGMYQQSNNENLYFTALGTFLVLTEVRTPDADMFDAAGDLYVDLCKAAQKYHEAGSNLQN